MSLASGDLTTLASAKAYLTSAPSDSILSGLITRMSRMILTELNRSLLVPKDYVEQFNGTGTRALVLPNWPVLSIASFSVSGGVISNVGQDNEIFSSPYGFRFQSWNGLPPGDPAVLEFTGGAYLLRGLQNVVATYRAGYRVTNEAATIPTTMTHTITPTAPYGIWATDEGVTYSSGVALTPIPTGTPLVGQYLPPDPNASSPRFVYTFAAADGGQGVLLSYGFIPADVEQVALELIAERSSYRSRPGIRSQMLAGQETISYDTSGFTSFIRTTLGQYCNVLPPAIGANV